MALGSLQTEGDLERFIAARISQIPAGSIQSLVAFMARPVVVPANVAPGVIEAQHIQAHTIIAENIAASTITSNEIAARTIVATNIAAHTITATEIMAGSISAESIEAETITTELLAAEVVTAAKIQARTITADRIQVDSLTATEIAAEAITATEIAAHTVTAGQIAAGTITSTEIASATITGSNIAGATITASKMNITELSALTANAGTITAGTITGATVRTAATGTRVVLNSEGLKAYNAVEALLSFDIATGNLYVKGEVKAGSTVPASTVTGLLTNAQIEAIAAAKITGQIVETQIGKEAISTEKLLASSVTAAKIAANTITAGQIAAGTITSTEIKAETIEASDIKAGTITTTQIAANTILGEDIAASTITGTNIAASTIAASKLTVTELSSITANLGTITAGTITGATFRTAAANPKVQMDATGLNSYEASGATAISVTGEGGINLLAETSGYVAARVITFLDPGNGKTSANVFSYSNAAAGIGRLQLNGVSHAFEKESDVSIAAMDANNSINASNIAGLYIHKGKATGQKYIKATFTNYLSAQESVTLLESGLKSDFLQLTATAKRKINSGSVLVRWSVKSAASDWKKIEHGIGAVPVVLTEKIGEDGGIRNTEVRNKTASSFEVRVRFASFEVEPGAETQVDWLAIG